MKTPVLFLVFNRPDSTRRVFEAIRAAKPARLYVGADGPRPGREGEAKRCDLVREIATSVDWACEVKTLFNDANLGCRFAVARAADWFFANEPEGIVLEDDCLPHPDFFTYCEWALASYRDDKDVWHINGNNFGAPSGLFGGKEVGFGALAQVWGWASWSDRWRRYQGNPFYLSRTASTARRTWKLSPWAKRIKEMHLLSLKKGLDTWEYQWQVTILNAGGLCLSSKSNLVSNIGDDDFSTRTRHDKRTHLPTHPMARELAYLPPRINRRLTRWYETKMGLSNPRRLARALAIRGRRVIINSYENALARVLFGRPKPIVVASSGRSGSTMLFRAIAAGLVRKRFGLTEHSRLGGWFCFLARGYVDRLVDISGTPQPVQKTHALFDDQYAAAAKYIFVFGDPLESAQSTEMVTQRKGRVWLDSHLYHLESSGVLEDLYENDILNYEVQLSSWMSGAPGSVLAVHFSDIWTKQSEISDYVGFEVNLPEMRARREKPMKRQYNHVLFDRLRALESDARKRTLHSGRERPSGVPKKIVR